MTAFQGFVGGLGRVLSVNANSETLTNWFPEGPDSQGAQAWLCPTPGLAVYVEGLKGPIRGLFSQDGRAFIAGQHFYEVDGAGLTTDYGAMAVDLNPVSITSNGHGGHQLLVLSGGLGYIFDLSSNTLTPIGATSFPTGAVMGDFIGGYFVVLQAGTSKFFLSALFDGTQWDGTDVGQLSDTSDNLIALRVINNNLWLMGSNRTEPWYNSGATFPLQPIPNALIEQGTGAPYSVAEIDGTLLMVVSDEHGAASIVASNGYGLQRVSNHAVEVRLSHPDVNIYESVGFAYQELGHWFYVLTCPTTGPTLVYDKTYNTWHERGVWNPGLGQFDPVWAQCHMYAFGRHLVGSRRDGTVYEQSVQFVTDAGTPIRRVRTCPHLNAEHQWLFFSQLEVELEAGLGNTNPPAVDPEIALRYSDDGGHVFSAWRTQGGGAVGQYKRRAYWPALGRSQDRVFELAVTSEIPWRITAANLRVEPGTGMR